MGLWDTGAHMTIFPGPHRSKIKLLTLENLGVNTVTHGRQVLICLWVGPFGSFELPGTMVPV